MSYFYRAGKEELETALSFSDICTIARSLELMECAKSREDFIKGLHGAIDEIIRVADHINKKKGAN